MPSITNKPFEYCGSLSELTLTRLHLAKLTEQSLLGLGSLKKLDMSYNKFVEFPENVFQWLGSLLEFNLSFNFLNNDLAMTSILDAFPQLEVLKLAGSSYSAFLQHSSILPYNFLGNQYENIPVVMSLQGLREIDLSRNRISSWPEGKFDGLQMLQTINLHGNSIEWIHAQVFATLKNLQKLDLSKNLLKIFEGYFYLGNLQVLNLNMNMLTDLGNATMMGEVEKQIFGLLFTRLG